MLIELVSTNFALQDINDMNIYNEYVVRAENITHVHYGWVEEKSVFN